MPSQWVAEELGLAQRLGKPLLLLKGQGVSQVHGLPDLTSTQAMTLGDATQNPSALASFLSS